MSNDEPRSLFSAVTGGVLIASLNLNDAILGHGKGASQFIGNLQFRSRIEECLEEYLAVSKGQRHPARKARILRELVYQTHPLGGRFLKPVDKESPGEAWYKVANLVALEKCQQVLWVTTF